MTRLVLRNVEVDGQAGQDVRLEDGRIAAIGPGLPRAAEEIDGRGGALIPGLCDHHIHLFALAAHAESVTLEGVATPSAFAARLAAACAEKPPGGWVRVLGYDEGMAGELTRADLDRLAPAHQVRVQHRTGGLWVLNSLALATLGQCDDPPGLERETGRLWRGDAWLRARLRSEPPPLAPVGHALTACGVTAVTDASVTTDADAATRLAAAHRAGDLPQRLTLMSGGPLQPPPDAAFAVGPLKILLDDHALPEFDQMLDRIADARRQGRNVAVHCVTAGELALTLAAFEAAGARPGDRIEHGSVIPAAAIGPIRRLGLIVVTQSAFVAERGDRYLAEVDAHEQPDLYRCASLVAAGVPVAGSSDAPYASADPWAGIRAAISRRTAEGRPLGLEERASAEQALALYLDHPAAPGRLSRRVALGEPADLCLLKSPLRDVLAGPNADQVAATLVGGEVVFLRIN